jgi:hypothetical protein
MNIVSLLLLTVLQFIAGIGVLGLFNIQLRNGIKFPVAMLLGVAICSLVPFLLELLHIPLRMLHVMSALVLTTLLLNIRRKRRLSQWVFSFANIRVKLYELPFILVLLFIFFVSAWRCYYYPPWPRDLTSGAEVIAEYAVREKTMVNSTFSIDLSSTNNPYKPAFITSLQIIYKYAGFPFGQVWLSVVFGSLLLLLYQLLCENVHRLLAGVLLLCFLAIPVMYDYTYIALFDYSNAVFFFVSVYFLSLYDRNGMYNYLLFAGFLMGIATYIRSETLVLACFFIPLILYMQAKGQRITGRQVFNSFGFVLPAVILYLLSITLYNGYYLPETYNIGDQVNGHLLDLTLFIDRFQGMNSHLLFSKWGISLYGYFIILFLVLLAGEALRHRLRFSRMAGIWLFTVLAVYLGLPFLGYLLPLMDLEHSTKRAMFKIFPPMLLYLSHNQLLTGLSARLSKLG